MYTRSEQFFQTNIYQTTLKRRADFITFMADFLAIALPIAGYFLPIRDMIEKTVRISMFAAAILIPACLLLANIILTKRFTKYLENQTHSEAGDFLLSHREHAEKTAQKKLAFLRKLRHFTSSYSVLLGLFGAVCGLFGGMLGFLTSVLSLPFTFFLILAALSGLRFPTPESFFDNVYSSASEKDYPEIYKMAKTASDTLGCKRKIKIILTYTYNMAAMKMGKFHCIIIGIPLINHLNREEFYSTLLHEFAHLSNRNLADWSEREYALRLSHGTPHYLGSLTSPIYSYLDARYSFEFSLYYFAASLSLENYSDRAMKLYGDPKAAASSLVKTFYFEKFQWERFAREYKILFSPEEPNENDLPERMEDLRSAIRERSEIWEKLINKEIISREATHPTVKMRLDTLGIRDHSIQPDTTDEKYSAEAKKALERITYIISRELKQGYEFKRKRGYLDHLRVIEKWEREGQPIDPEGYIGVVRAMRICGRFSDADNLCQRVIEELPTRESAFAHYVHGRHIMRDYNDEGISHIYTAIEYNSNLVEKGLESINEYCRITGNSKELEKCRQKERERIDYRQKMIRGTYKLKKKDKLYPAELPEDLLEGIINRLREVDTEKYVSRLFVAKRIIDDEFRTLVVITFKIDTPEFDRQAIMKRMQHYINFSSEWPFALRRYEEMGKAKIEKVKGSLVYKG